MLHVLLALDHLLFRIQQNVVECHAQEITFKVQSSKFKVQSSKFKVQSSKFKVQSCPAHFNSGGAARRQEVGGDAVAGSDAGRGLGCGQREAEADIKTISSHRLSLRWKSSLKVRSGTRSTRAKSRLAAHHKAFR
jgi:hypothetical protein